MSHPLPTTAYRLRITAYGLPLEKIVITAVTLLAFALRVWQLAAVPTGWRDDELINVLVISQKVLNGNWQLYYADASGNEALYHALNAVMFGLFGANFLGIRLLSAFLGVTAVPLTWLLGRKLFGSWVGLLAASALALSFWSLMYSRFGLRQIATPTLMLLAFYFFWRGLSGGYQLPITNVGAGLKPAPTDYRLRITDYILAGFWTALGFYVYFAGRGVPVILLAFCLAMLLVARPLLKQQWRGIVLMFVVTAVLALPLVITLQRQPAADARVAELALPLIEARQGNFTLIQEHLVTTLSMFHADGDDEWLYNIPHRPIFGPLGALFLWAGVIMAAYCALLLLWHNLISLFRQTNYELRIMNYELPITDYGLPSTFLLIWWFIGLSPGFISIPPASLGHTILAQPATFMLMALPVGVIGNWVIRRKLITQLPNYSLPVLLTVLLLASIAVRDLPDYFVNWPQRGMVRFLYHTDYFELADYLNDQGLIRPSKVDDFAVAGLLAGPWDRLALEIDLNDPTAVIPRWYHPERAVFIRPSLNLIGIPNVPFVYDSLFEPLDRAPIGGFEWAKVDTVIDTTQATCFQNGLCSVSAMFDAETGILELGWEVARPLELPPFELISNPPPPGVYAGPRLLAFGQLLDAEGNFVAGDDGLWVDPYSLQPGDLFLQQHHLMIPDGAAPAAIAFGLYDPLTGERILTDDGRDHLTLNVGE